MLRRGCGGSSWKVVQLLNNTTSWFWKLSEKHVHIPERTKALQRDPVEKESTMSSNFFVRCKFRTCCTLRSPSVCFNTCESGLNGTAHSEPDIKPCNDMLYTLKVVGGSKECTRRPQAEPQNKTRNDSPSGIRPARA